MHAARGLLVGARCPGWEDRVDAVDAESCDPMLIRSDGYVAWTGTHGSSDTPPAGLTDALTRWFGPPTAPAPPDQAIAAGRRH